MLIANSQGNAKKGWHIRLDDDVVDDPSLDMAYSYHIMDSKNGCSLHITPYWGALNGVPIRNWDFTIYREVDAFFRLIMQR